jgi:Protein of unknown function (DUF664)
MPINSTPTCWPSSAASRYQPPTRWPLRPARKERPAAGQLACRAIHRPRRHCSAWSGTWRRRNAAGSASVSPGWTHPSATRPSRPRRRLNRPSLTRLWPNRRRWRGMRDWLRRAVRPRPRPRLHRLDPEGEPVSLRELLVHMMEQYTPHNGHADLLTSASASSTPPVPWRTRSSLSSRCVIAKCRGGAHSAA